MKYNQNNSMLIMCWVLGAVALLAPAAHADVAPAVPDLNLPMEQEEIVAEQSAVIEPAAEPEVLPQPPVTQPKKASRRQKRVTNKAAAPKPAEPVKEEQPVEPVSQPVPPVVGDAAVLQEVSAAEPVEENFEPARDMEKPAAVAQKTPKVVYAPSTDRDPTLSPSDLKEIQRREMERLRAIEMEKQRKLDAERRRLAELERLRQLELERLRDPSKEIRGKIRINGIIGQEVFIGNKVYTVGKTVLGARIVSIQPEEVVFMYKGQKFTKKVQLK